MQIASAAIVGVGLIGGSLAAAWRQADFARRIVGIESNQAAAEQALSLGLVDQIVEVVPADTPLIAVCTPSDQIAAQVGALREHPAAMFDVGSVKGAILAELAEHGPVPSRYVPAHPISGSERSGPGAARADLFTDATTVITPLDGTDADACQLVEAAWRAAGAEVVSMTPAEHDQMLALTSHLPHLLAFVFMQQVPPEALDYTGGGFRDFTRIAGANPELWWRILRMNKAEVLAALGQYQTNLQAFSDALGADDADAALAQLRAAVALRQSLDQ